MSIELKELGYLVILLAPLDAFKFMSGYFSAYRVVLFILLVATIFDMISKRQARINRNLFFWLFGFEIINILAYMLSTQKSLGVSFFLNDTLGVVLIFLFSYTYSEEDVDTVLLFYVRSQYITVLFSLYSIFLHFVMGRVISSHISFFLFSFDMSNNQLNLIARTKSFLPQLFMPYATTLHLDFSVGIAALICLHFMIKNKKKQKLFLVLSTVFSLLILLSAQKGPIIAYLFALCFFISYYNRKRGMAKTIFYLLMIILLGLILVSTFASKVISYTIERFIEFNIRTTSGDDRHILLIYEAIRIWLNNLKTILVGVGYSSASMQRGYYTYIPETFLCTYATLLAEKGILGIVSIAFYARFWKYLKRGNDLLKNIFVFIIVSFLFYELRYVQTSWIIIAVFSFAVFNRNKSYGEIIYGQENK